MTISEPVLENEGADNQKEAPSKDIALQSRNLWKIFDPAATRFCRQGGELTAEVVARYGWKAAVVDCSISAERGRVFVIMGLSGSGKSTLVRCLARLIAPTSGTVTFDGSDFLAVSDRELIEIRRRKMGMVFQNFALLPNRTVLGNVAFPLQVQGRPRNEMLNSARRMIELVGLAGKEGSYPFELSGGQQQRVGIARSLAASPELWILDEPFSALDPLIRRDLQDEFLKLQRLLHKTIVFITHDFDEAVKLADQIAIMKDGRIEQSGTAEELVLSPATAYVREFTRTIPRMRVLRAGSVASKIQDQESLGGSVSADAALGSVLRQSLDSPLPLRVRDHKGRTVGALRRQTVLTEIERLAAGKT